MKMIKGKLVIDIKKGDTTIVSQYSGDNLIYSSGYIDERDYFCLETLTGNTNISFIINGTLTTTPVLKYSYDKRTWTSLQFNTEISLTTENPKVYIRGNNNSFNKERNFISITSDSNFKVSGNIMSLLDKTCESTTIPDSFCFTNLFFGNNELVNASELKLPATTLASYCYAYMFSGCTSLVNAPTLSATTLTIGCYQYMFYNCTSLVNAPALPATTLANSCYQCMFYGCTSLVNAPALPATTLTIGCYQYMFYNCTSLVNAPALPATTLANYCYYYMFYNCTSLVNAPALPATTLAECCYFNMFSGCISLVNVPALPATTLAGYCYARIFDRCSKIKISRTQTDEYINPYRIPYSGTGTTGTSSLVYMFLNTGGTFTGTPEINTVYYTSNEII